MNFSLSKTLNKINDPLFQEMGIELFVKREDLVHPVYGGNKFRKLKYNLEYARVNKFDTLLTFGGAYSNHIAATAFAGKEAGFKTIGIIRGEELNFFTDPARDERKLNKTLWEAKENGMELHFVSRETYKNIYEKDYWNALRKKFGNLCIIPEGGSNEPGLKGCGEIAEEIEIDFDHICCPVGTGTTLIGIAGNLKPHQKALGIVVYKNKDPAVENIACLKHNFLAHNSSIYSQIKIQNYCFSGYGKSNAELNDFCNYFTKTFSIRIEPVYTGKMFYGIYDLARKGYFPKGSIVIAVHTGGLQYMELDYEL